MCSLDTKMAHQRQICPVDTDNESQQQDCSVVTEHKIQSQAVVMDTENISQCHLQDCPLHATSTSPCQECIMDADSVKKQSKTSKQLQVCSVATGSTCECQDRYGAIKPVFELKGDGERVKLHKSCLSIKEKQELIAGYDNLPKTTSQRQAAILLGVSQSTLNRHLKDRLAITQSCGPSHRKRQRQGKEPLVETALAYWIQAAMAKKKPLNGPIVRRKAESLADKMGKRDFKVTCGWYTRFKKREGLTFGNAVSASVSSCTWCDKDLLDSGSDESDDDFVIEAALEHQRNRPGGDYNQASLPPIPESLKSKYF